MRFSGPARWNVHEPVRTLANSFISFHRLPQGEKRCMRIPAGAPEKDSPPWGAVSFLQGDSNQNRKPRGNCGFALPVAEKARPQFPQRSKNARIGVSPMRFSGPARWNVHQPVQTLADSFISFCRSPQGEMKCMRIPAGAPNSKKR